LILLVIVVNELLERLWLSVATNFLVCKETMKNCSGTERVDA
jgi:hypothetical protein